jgi:HemY protein
MIRALIYLLLLAALAVGFAWFAENPGQLTINWPGYRIDITLFWFTVAILVTVGFLFFLVNFIGRIITGPRRLRRHLKNRRRRRGYAALRRGIFAVGAGDEATAARYAIEARRAMSSEPMTTLLQAQSAQLSGDHRTAQRLFEAMSENPESRLLGLRGLFLEASREGHQEPARQYAARAMALNPALPWPVHALFNMQCGARDWRGALETLAIARNHRHIDRKTHDRRKAVLLTAQAQDLEQSETARAADLALEAHRIAPDFVPAAVIAGRILASQGSTQKAGRVLARTWQYAPHPDLALNYAYSRPGDSPHDRLDRIRSLIVMTPDHPEARIAWATAAVDARDWDQAREALEPLLSKNPTTRICALMARIEGGDKRDAGRVREWLARAVRAPRDAIWIADGVMSREWQPISPVTGTLDAFEWRVPPDQSKALASDPLLEEISALSHELETVGRQISDVKLADDDGAAEPDEPLTITATTGEAPAAPLPPPRGAPSPKWTTASLPQSASLTPPAGEAEASMSAEPGAPRLTTSKALPKSDAAERGDADAAVGAEVVAATVEAEVREAGVQPPPVPEAGAEATPTAQSTRKTPPKIFIPDRPPDDPGPEPGDFEEITPPYPGYRSH